MPDKKSVESTYWKMSEVCGRTECLMRELSLHKGLRESVDELSKDVTKAFEKFKMDYDFIEGVYKEGARKSEKHNKSKD